MRRDPLSSSVMRNVIIACIITLLCCVGCGGTGPTAYRVASDTDDRYYPRGDIHFVERGQRSKGVLVAATPGFNSPFEANWRTCLVPTPPTHLAGPVWTGGRGSGRAIAAAIWNLPRFRDVRYVGRYGDSARFRFREDAVWILGTDPLMLGLPAGSPRRTWREFAETATGVRDAKSLSPLPSFVARFVVDEELDQPLDRLVVFPSHFWSSTQGLSHHDGTAYVVKLPKPLTINDALAALAAGDPLRLGAVEQVALQTRKGRENGSDRENDRENGSGTDSIRAVDRANPRGGGGERNHRPPSPQVLGGAFSRPPPPPTRFLLPLSSPPVARATG